MKDKILCRVLTGPTASGKSSLAMRLAIEEDWDILCMDSMQIYRGMDIGTAKPTKSDRSRIHHYLLDLCDPQDTFSVAQYVEAAEKTVRNLYENGRHVLFVGGTGLYLEALMKSMQMGSVPADRVLRDKLHRIADAPGGRQRLDRILREVDPVTAGKLPLNDIRRRIRAIEVSRATGIPFSKQESSPTISPFSWIAVSTELERTVLYEKINRRVDTMIEDGLAEEVKNLLSLGVPENAQSMQAIGYKEIIPYLRGEYSLDKAAELIKAGTRHYAKRQITFLRRIGNIQYIPADDAHAYERLRHIMKSKGETEYET